MGNYTLDELYTELELAVDFDGCLDVFNDCDNIVKNLEDFKQIILRKALKFAVTPAGCTIVIKRAKDYKDIKEAATKKWFELNNDRKLKTR